MSEQKKEKTFMERFLDLEASYSRDSEYLARSLMGIAAELASVKEQLAAVYALAADGALPPTPANVEAKMNEMKFKEVETRVQTMEQAGHIIPDETVTSDSLFVFKSPDILLGYQLVKNITNEEVKSQLLGKKAGDVVSEYEIVKVYKLKEQENKEETSVQ
jgi:hypothetical protein